jgi:hypothetical protein
VGANLATAAGEGVAIAEGFAGEGVAGLRACESRVGMRGERAAADTRSCGGFAPPGVR